MKSCPVCQRVFPNDAGFCPADGTALTTASLAPVAPSADDPRIGARLCGRYEIRRVVADGGMGRVYEGIDKQTDTRVAVKVLHEDVSKDDVAPERVVRMLAQVAIGLDGAHARNFIHRDLKPDNLFLCGTRQGDIVKLLDFGSVKDQSGNRKKLTVLGTTIGSPYYMSPEQAQGLDTIDARADVFALAALTYECVTGEVPFAGNNGPSILLAIMTKDPIPPSAKAQGAKYPIPPALDDVI